MNTPFLPLAEVFDWWEIIPVVIFLVLGAIGSALKKAAEKRQEKEDREKWARRREQHGQQVQQQAQGHRATVQRPPTPAPPPQPAMRRQAPVQAGMQAPPPVIEARHRRRTVEVQMARQQIRRVHQRPPQRTTHPQPAPQAVKAASSQPVEVEIVPPPIAPLMHRPAVAARRIMLPLHDPQTVRQAIIYHEILSPPKALRQGRQMWEL